MFERTSESLFFKNFREFELKKKRIRSLEEKCLKNTWMALQTGPSYEKNSRKTVRKLVLEPLTNRK